MRIAAQLLNYGSRIEYKRGLFKKVVPQFESCMESLTPRDS